MTTVVETQSIVKVVKIVTEDGISHYVTLHYDSEFKTVDASLTISYGSGTELKAIQALLDQCKLLGAISLKELDNKLTG